MLLSIVTRPSVIFQTADRPPHVKSILEVGSLIDLTESMHGILAELENWLSRINYCLLYNIRNL